MKLYVLLDAGGTLLFPNFDWLSSLLSSKGIHVAPIEMFKEFSKLNYEIDKALKDGGENPWESGGLAKFAKQMFSSFVKNEKVLNELVKITVEEDERKSLWSYTFDRTRPTLEKLKNAGYHMSVISNSDGRVENMITDVGLRGYFDRVYDSHVVGISKPDPKIYELALDDLHLDPRDTIFVGDIFYIDVLGANIADIPAIHLDPFGYYRNWPGVRVKSVEEIPNLLKKVTIATEEFFPFDSDGKLRCEREIR